MQCDRDDCTGNHHAYPNLCPRTKEQNRLRKRGDAYMERQRVRRRAQYAALDGMAYAHLLLKHRRTKALIRIDKRRR